MSPAPIKLRCPLCERVVNRIEQRRNYTREGVNVTIWRHGRHGEINCFIVDDLHEPEDGTTPTLFEITPVGDSRARA